MLIAVPKEINPEKHGLPPHRTSFKNTNSWGLTFRYKAAPAKLPASATGTISMPEPKSKKCGRHL